MSLGGNHPRKTFALCVSVPAYFHRSVDLQLVVGAGHILRVCALGVRNEK
jgi:hypothetical protein